jgi:hypothetical protein
MCSCSMASTSTYMPLTCKAYLSGPVDGVSTAGSTLQHSIHDISCCMAWLSPITPINASKTELLWFGSRRNSLAKLAELSRPVNLDNGVIKSTSVVRDLGFIRQRNVDETAHSQVTTNYC